MDWWEKMSKFGRWKIRANRAKNHKISCWMVLEVATWCRDEYFGWRYKFCTYLGSCLVVTGLAKGVAGCCCHRFGGGDRLTTQSTSGGMWWWSGDGQWVRLSSLGWGLGVLVGELPSCGWKLKIETFSWCCFGLMFFINYQRVLCIRKYWSWKQLIQKHIQYMYIARSVYSM